MTAIPAGIAVKLRTAAARFKLSVQDHRRKAASYLRAHPPWLWETSFFWLTVLGAVAVPVAVLAWWPHEHIIRYAGLGLQLAGIGTVWWGIRETRKLFEHPTFWMQTRQWFCRRPRYGDRAMAAGGFAGAAAFGGGRLSVWTTARPDATLEQRIAVLEQNLIHVRNDFTRFQNKTKHDIRQQDQAIKQEQQTRDSVHQEIREQMKATETGGLHISAMGALWLLVGATMGTIPDDLARWFG